MTGSGGGERWERERGRKGETEKWGERERQKGETERNTLSKNGICLHNLRWVLILQIQSI